MIASSPSWSNYGAKSVDIFAPGDKIYTASAVSEEKYQFDSGTSMAAPIVSCLAALLKSYYPKLTSNQIKDIILLSGINPDIVVPISVIEADTVRIHFSQLSKSGKIVNACNAFLMAENLVEEN